MDSERQSQIEASLRRHLDAGNEMLDGTDQLEAGQLHAWATRTTSLARDLADCVGDPIRNRVMELLDRPTIPDDANALMVLRITAGLSHRALGQKAGPSYPTISRLEEGGSCNVATAKDLADEWHLEVTELFDAFSPGERLSVHSVEQLREQMTETAEKERATNWLMANPAAAVS